MLQLIVDLQRDIYLAFAERIRIFAETGDWAQLAVFLPLGIVFGAVHALTPGHSKIVLATYLAGSCSCRMTEPVRRSEEHTSELQTLMRTSYAGFCLKKKQK